MPALGIVLPSAGIKDIPGSHKSRREIASQRFAFSLLFGGKRGILLLEEWPSISAPRRRTGALSARALADASETPVANLLSSYLNPIGIDQEKEFSRVYRRVVYDEKQWREHRSSFRHVRHIITLFSSRIVRALKPPVFTLTFWSLLVSLWDEGLELGYLPSFLPLVHSPALPFQLVAPALALLLVFRTNSSYSRFDEARKIWGSNVNRTRDFARQAVSWIQRPEDGDVLQELLRYTIAYPYTLKAHLVLGEDLATELKGVLLQHEQDTLLASSHRPNHVLQMMSNCLANVQLPDIQRRAMDRNVTRFHDNTGSCERIFQTPIPVSYTRLISRLLVVWHIFLPLALWDDCKILTALAVLTSAGALFCIDEVAVTIEEPFSILALPAICDGIQGSIKSLVKSHSDWAELNVDVEEPAEAPPAPPTLALRVPVETSAGSLALPQVPVETPTGFLAPPTYSPQVPVEALNPVGSLAPPTYSPQVPVETLNPAGSLAPPTYSPLVPVETLNPAGSLAPPTDSPQVPVETPAGFLAPPTYSPQMPVETWSRSLAPPTNSPLVPVETLAGSLAPPSYSPQVAVETIPWSTIVANLVWSNLLLGVLTIVKLFYAQQGTPKRAPLQLPAAAEAQPTSADSELAPPKEPPLVQEVSGSSDIYY